MIDGTLYLSTPTNRVIALDAATGNEQWVFDPQLDRSRDYSEVTSRGVAAWTDPGVESGESGVRRLFLGTLDGRLMALDASTGQLVEAFGDGGMIDSLLFLRGSAGIAGAPRGKAPIIPAAER